MYCKDTSIPNVRAHDWSHTVINLSAMLSQCDRIKCTIDYYEKQVQENWDKWTLDRIGESNYVVLVMSPMMATGLCHPSHQSLPMEKALFFCDSVSALVRPPKFVPVFLNDCIPSSHILNEWLPPTLKKRGQFHLHNFSEFVNGYKDKGESFEDWTFHEYIKQSLMDPSFAELASLVRHFQGIFIEPGVSSMTFGRRFISKFFALNLQFCYDIAWVFATPATPPPLLQWDSIIMIKQVHNATTRFKFAGLARSLILASDHVTSWRASVKQARHYQGCTNLGWCDMWVLYMDVCVP